MVEDRLKEWKKLAEKYPIIIARDLDDVYILVPLTDNFMLTINPGYGPDEGKYEQVLTYITFNSTVWDMIPHMRWERLEVKTLKQALEHGDISKIVFYKLRYHIASFLKEVKDKYNIDIDIEGTYKLVAEYVNNVTKLIQSNNKQQ